MNEYETEVLIDELEKLVVSKTMESKAKDFKIAELKKEIERLENLLTPKIEN